MKTRPAAADPMCVCVCVREREREREYPSSNLAVAAPTRRLFTHRLVGFGGWVFGVVVVGTEVVFAI